MHIYYLIFYLAPASILWAAEITRRRMRVHLRATVQPLGSRLTRIILPPASRATALAFLRASGAPNAHIVLSFHQEKGTPWGAHPFSTLSCSEGMICYIRRHGSFTNTLHQMGAQKERQSTTTTVSLSVNGVERDNWAFDLHPDEDMTIIGG